MALITLTSDFAPDEFHIAELKGVLSDLAPGAILVDISHGIRPYDIGQAGYLVARACPRFPRDTVHLVWINPDIGRPRRGVAVRSGGHWYVAPDNGVLSRVLHRDPTAESFEIEPSRFGHPRPASSGLDVLAPAAARLAAKVPVALFGRPAVGLFLEPMAGVDRLPGTWVEGVIEFIDHFGNAWTNITRQEVAKAFDPAGKGPASLAVHVCDAHIEGIADGLGRYAVGAAVAFFNGPDLLEIAVNHGNAAERLKLSVGNKVRITALHDTRSEPFRG